MGIVVFSMLYFYIRFHEDKARRANGSHMEILKKYKNNTRIKAIAAGILLIGTQLAAPD